MLAEFLSRAKKHGWTAESQSDLPHVFAMLQDDTGLGTGCGTCIPYARVALRTGQTVLPIMSNADMERVLGSGQATQVSTIQSCRP